jgi:catechol 2,3-dioxygenase-like lactoylglutathione lyase family enzyme
MSHWYTRPILSVADIARSVDFYVGKLGFKEDWRHAEEGKVIVAQVSRSGCELLLDCQEMAPRGASMFFISLDDPLLETLAAFRAEMREKGVPVKDGRWGYHLAIVEDPDGNQLTFPYPQDYTPPETPA